KETENWYYKQHIDKNSLSKFMKDLIHETGIEIDSLLTNHFGRKISAQLMQDINVEEQIIMNITGHRSVDAIQKYKMPNDQQKMGR
ncbi:12795_t:CDS:1, partial [Funneliformis mosseae]